MGCRRRRGGTRSWDRCMMVAFLHVAAGAGRARGAVAVTAVDRREFFVASIGAAAALLAQGAMADEPASAAKGTKGGRLYPCPQEGVCLSSSSSKAPAKYVAPWSFESDTAEAHRALLEYADKVESFVVMAKEPSYVWIKYTGGVFGGIADLEFNFSSSDRIVAIRAASRRSASFYAFSAPSVNLKGLLTGIRQDLGWADLDSDLLLI